jgi:dTDP-4-amino-4,6-dideoxygalactose transaminase
MKLHDTRTLAVLGGEPAFSEVLHVGRPNIGDRRELQRRLDRVIDSRWLTNHGPMVQELEERIALALGVRHCITTANATLGLEVTARMLELRGEVIVPSFTFVATAHALRWLGLKPVFCDVDPVTHNLDPQRVEELITPRTTAIMGVHVWGRPCDTPALAGIAHEHDLRLLFDAAHAFSSARRGVPVGGFGDAEIFSFHATKFVNAFEGGAITTNDDDLAQRLRLATNFGFENFDRVVSLGTNAKMSEPSAAMALTSLDSMQEFVRTNRDHYREYVRGLAAIPGIRLIDYAERDRPNYQYVVVEVDQARCGLTRDTLLTVLHAENVLARRYFFPGCHRMEPYRTEDPGAAEWLPETEALAQRVLVLPTGTAVEAADVRLICDVISRAVAHADLLAGVRPVVAP